MSTVAPPSNNPTAPVGPDAVATGNEERPEEEKPLTKNQRRAKKLAERKAWCQQKKQIRRDNGHSSNTSTSPASTESDSEDDFWRELPLYPEGTKDILGNGDLLKLLVKHGVNDHKPAIGDTVHINYEAIIEESGVLFFSTKAGSRPNPIQMKLGQHGNIRGLDLGVRSMTDGEVAKFTCKPHLAYLESGMTRQKFIFEIELLKWDFGEDVTDEGEIFRCVQTDGDQNSESPHASGNIGEPVAQVQVAIIGYQNRKRFLKKELTYDLGEAATVGLPDGIDVVLRYFKIGERSLIKFAAHSKWSYSKESHANLDIDPDLDLVFDIKLLTWKERSDLSYESLSEKVAAAKKFKEQGTRLLKDEKLHQALDKYSQAIYLLENSESAMKGFERRALTDADLEREQIKEKTAWMLGRPSIHDENAEPVKEKKVLHWGHSRCGMERDALYLSCLLNAALVNLRLGDRAEDALAQCELALAESPGLIKALFRKAQALQQLRRWDLAIENYRKVLNFEPQNTAAIEQLRICKNPPKKKKTTQVQEKVKFDRVFDDLVERTREKAPKSETGRPQDVVWTSVKNAKPSKAA